MKTKKTVSLHNSRSIKSDTQIQPTVIITLFILCLILISVSILMLYLNDSSTLNTSNNSIINQETPKDIDWFYNRSAELKRLQIRAIDLDNKTAAFIAKHGTDETGYDPNEKNTITTFRTLRNMLTNTYNNLAAEYNSNAANMNRSWDKTLPRQIYDIP